MKALVGAFNQEKALVGAFSVIVQPVVEPMDRFTALFNTVTRLENICPDYYDGAALARGHTLLYTILGLGRGETWQLSGARHGVRGTQGRVTQVNIPIPTSTY